MHVFLTIDTEVWNFYGDITRDLESAIFGRVGQKEYGLKYQLALFKEFDLKANYFVEPLFTSIAGDQPLRDIVALIKTFNQDVQLHLHTEWLARSKNNILKSGAVGQHMKDFTVDDQTELVRYGIDKLSECGAQNISAFRAGNYGGNFDTLRALSNNDIAYDSTHNTCYLNDVCQMGTGGLLLQPKPINGVYELPITFFSDWPGHYRHMQITACSTYELKNALLDAWRRGWYCIVIVLHTFEAIKRIKKSGRKIHRVEKIVLQRLKSICEFLSENRDKFNTMKFSELKNGAIPKIDVDKPLRSNIIRTFHRFYQQTYRRFF